MDQRPDRNTVHAPARLDQVRAVDRIGRSATDVHVAPGPDLRVHSEPEDATASGRYDSLAGGGFERLRILDDGDVDLAVPERERRCGRVRDSDHGDALDRYF